MHDDDDDDDNDCDHDDDSGYDTDLHTVWGLLIHINPPTVLWLFYFQHTWCAVAVIMEGAFIKHKYPRNRVGLGLLLSFGVAYLLWLV